MGLFKKKAGGTVVGNLIRGVVNTKLGLNLQAPVPALNMGTSGGSSPAQPIQSEGSPPVRLGGSDSTDIFGGVRSVIDNIRGATKDARDVTRGSKILMLLLGVGILVFIFKQVRHR